MTTLALTIAGRAARNQATLDQIDAGSGPGEIRLYTANGGTLLGTRPLEDPAGSIDSGTGRLVLAAPSATALAVATGGATWGELCDSTGAVIATGAVSDENGYYTDGSDNLVNAGAIGPWILQGTNGTKIYDGGALVIASITLG